jgi:LPS-assembly protein
MHIKGLRDRGTLLLSSAGLAVLGGLVFFPQYLRAAEPDNRWQYCSTQFMPADFKSSVPITGKPLASDEIRVTADKAHVENLQVYHFEGNVILQQTEGTIRTEHAIYDRSTNKLYAEGTVRYQTGSHVLTGKKADVQLDTDTATVSDAEFWLIENHLRGEAQSISIINEDVLQLDQVLFTSCDKENESWVLKAASLNLEFA